MKFDQSAYQPRVISIPRLGLFSLFLSACGLMAIWSVFSPQTLSSIIPNWKNYMGVIVPIGVVLGLCGSVLRIAFRLASLMFWLVALLCVAGTDLKSFIPAFPAQVATQSVQGDRVQIAPRYAGKPTKPALEDSAYFPSRSVNSGIPIIDQLLK